jgi:hypothetical protein
MFMTPGSRAQRRRIGGSASSVIGPPGGRLTLATGTPVMSATVTASNTIFYTPYKGQFCPIWNGVSFDMKDLGGELSQLTTDATKSPAAMNATNVTDLYVWNDNGTFRCTRGFLWAVPGNHRGTGAGTPELIRVNGILVNRFAVTNGPAAGYGTYVGTVASNSGGTIDYIFGFAQSGGGAAALNVWNMYNRVCVVTTVTDSGIAYTYNTNTIRQARASVTNQITTVLGLAEDGIILSYTQSVTMSSTSGRTVAWGLGFDSTSAYGQTRTRWQNPAAVSTTQNQTNAGVYNAGTGARLLVPLEQGDGTGTNSWNVDLNGSFSATLWL